MLAQESQSSKLRNAAPSKRLLAAIELADIKIKLTPMGKTEKRGIGWSPKGNKVPLKANDDALVGAIKIGNFKQVKLELSIEPREGGDGLLRIDLNSDDCFSDKETVKVSPVRRLRLTVRDCLILSVRMLKWRGNSGGCIKAVW